MARVATPSTFFVFVVVRHQGRVLVVQEAKHGQRWYAPAGGIEVGETVAEAAIRETMEEAGVRIEPLGVAGIETRWLPPAHPGDAVRAWWRYVVVARPVGDPRTPMPKQIADEHSLGARWVTREEAAALPLRHPEVLGIFELPEDVPLVPMPSEAALPLPRGFG